ncbi:MAG: glycosyltransferase [Actinobacteria bacterium]|nr:glycosyltransferase [Actinomycetota bacterium]
MAPARFSILTPVYETPAPVLWKMLESVRRQSFGDWEFCLVDDASPSSRVRKMLDRVATEDPRVRVFHRPENGGIVAASNDALELAEGEFIVLLDHDDQLHPDALRLVDAAIGDDEEVDYVYTDEDKIDESGHHAGPFLKPDWSPERMRAQMYTCHLSVFRRALVDEVGGFDADFEGAQDWDLVLRTTEQARKVAHVPRVLYHWRSIATSAAAGEDVKPWAFEAGKRAVQAHCERIGLEARVERDVEDQGVYHLEPQLSREPAVSIVIPTNGQRREVRYEDIVLVENCVRSIVAASTYSNYEILVVVDAGTPGAVVEELYDLAGDRLKIVDFDRPFNFSDKINAGAVLAEGDHLVLLNDDIEVATPDWLERMAMYSQLDGVGAVGARLLLEDGRLQHGGVNFERGLPGHPYYGWPGDAAGYANNLKVTRNLLAVTGACLMTPRDLFEEVGGLSLTFPINYNDVDYCLKLREIGRRVVFEADVTMLHFESSSRSSAVSEWEMLKLRARWSALTDPDPYSNPHLHAEMPTPFSAFDWARRRPRLPSFRRPPGEVVA